MSFNIDKKNKKYRQSYVLTEIIKSINQLNYLIRSIFHQNENIHVFLPELKQMENSKSVVYQHHIFELFRSKYIIPKSRNTLEWLIYGYFKCQRYCNYKEYK